MQTRVNHRWQKNIRPRYISAGPVNTEGHAQPTEGNALPIQGAPDPIVPIDDGGQLPTQHDLSGQLPVENENPEDRSVLSRRRAIRLVRYLRNALAWLDYHRPGRLLTREEILLAEEKASRKLEAKAIQKDAGEGWKQIGRCLTNLGLCYRFASHERVGIPFAKNIQEVTARIPYDCTPNAIWYHLDTRPGHLPRGLSIDQLTTDDLMTHILFSIQRHVRAEYRIQTGVWYILERGGNASGLPSHVMWPDLIDAMPPSADGLTIPMGMTHNGRRVYRSFGDMISMLVGGTTGAGKSTFLHNVICTLATRNSSDRVKFVLVDLKFGNTFRPYLDMPHMLALDCAPRGLITDRNQVPLMLKELLEIGAMRANLLNFSNVEDVGRYNQRHTKNPLPSIFLIVDELGDLILDKEIKAQAEEQLINIGSKFRSLGFNVILATQTPVKEIISLRIRSNMVSHLALSCANIYQSMSILGNGSAVNLGCKGRAVLQFDSELTLQTPYLGRPQVEEIVAGVIGGKYIPVQHGHDVSELEIMEWALNYEDGWLRRERIYAKYRERKLPRAVIDDWLEEWETQEHLVRGARYKVTPAGGSRGRRMVAIDLQNIGEVKSEEVKGENAQPADS